MEVRGGEGGIERILVLSNRRRANGEFLRDSGPDVGYRTWRQTERDQSRGRADVPLGFDPRASGSRETLSAGAVLVFTDRQGFTSVRIKQHRPDLRIHDNWL